MTPADAGALARKDLEGLGFFYASADMAGAASYAAAKCGDAGARWAAILIESVDGRRQNPTRVAQHADALRAEGILPILYTFPAPGGDLDASAEHARACAAASGCWHVCLDLEPFDGEDWTQVRIDKIVRRARFLLGPTGRISITVFSRPRWSRIAWSEFVPVILQVYQRAADPRTLKAAMAKWPPGTIPAAGTYLGDNARLRRDLLNVGPYRPFVASVRSGGRGSLAIWALATTDAEERAILREFA